MFSVLCVLREILSYASAKKKTKKLKGFQFLTFMGKFQMKSWQDIAGLHPERQAVLVYAGWFG